MAVFFVSQNQTYSQERSGGYVWSPRKTRNGRNNRGYTTMTEIAKGDFILHSSGYEIRSVSEALTNCYESERPIELNAEGQWNSSGYRVDLKYADLYTSYKLDPERQWLASHPSRYGPFNSAGGKKQTYMSLLSDEQAEHLITNLLLTEKNGTARGILARALKSILGYDPNNGPLIAGIDDYDPEETEKILSLSNSATFTADGFSWDTSARKQEMVEGSSGGLRPKRNPAIAANALARANYLCEIDSVEHVFTRKNGTNYVEPHHLVPLSKYDDFSPNSLDREQNIVSLCCYCHRLVHYGTSQEKEPILSKLYDERKDLLANVGIMLTREQLLSYYS